jgi:hypothetical protein
MEKVKTGEKVVIRASDWNSFIDAANYTKTERQNQAGKGLKSGLSAGIISIKNCEEETDYPIYSALVLTGICVTPEVNENEFLSCPPTFEGRGMTKEREGMPFAILQEPIAAGEIGRAMLFGVTPARIHVTDKTAQYATPVETTSDSLSIGNLVTTETGTARILWKAGEGNEQWVILQLGGSGAAAAQSDGAILCQTTGDDNHALAGYEVKAYPNGSADMDKYYDARLFLVDVALGAKIPSGTWVIGHPCVVSVTGGND